MRCGQERQCSFPVNEVAVSYACMRYPGQPKSREFLNSHQSLRSLDPPVAEQDKALPQQVRNRMKLQNLLNKRRAVYPVTERSGVSSGAERNDFKQYIPFQLTGWRPPVVASHACIRYPGPPNTRQSAEKFDDEHRMLHFINYSILCLFVTVRWSNGKGSLFSFNANGHES